MYGGQNIFNHLSIHSKGHLIKMERCQRK